MSEKRRNVLAIGLSPEEFDRVAPFLARDEFEVDRFPSGRGALELTSQVAIEVLLVRFPLPDLELADFLREVRGEESSCRSSPIVVLTLERWLEEATAYVGRGANRVLDIDAARDEIQDVISALLAVAPRKAARFLAQLEIKLGDSQDRILCQTENLSASGMLIRTDRRYEIGTRIEFEFSLPDDVRPISGLAEVVRHTMIGRDQVGGIGVRFLSFSSDSERRFERYVEHL